MLVDSSGGVETSRGVSCLFWLKHNIYIYYILQL